MDANAFTRPRGCEDLDAPTRGRHRWIEDRLRQIWETWGYEEVGAPTFEYADLYHPDRVGELYSQLLVARLSEAAEFVVDSPREEQESGTLEPVYDVVLRPELTAPMTRGVVSRILAGEDIQWPLRLWSAGSVFRNLVPTGLQRREFHQVGAELIGAQGRWSDLEVCRLAVEGAGALGLPSFELRLGHARLGPAALAALGLKGERAERVAAGLAQKERWQARACLPESVWLRFLERALPGLLASLEALSRRADLSLRISKSTEPAQVLALLEQKLRLAWKLDKLTEAQIEGSLAWGESWNATDSVAAMRAFLPPEAQADLAELVWLRGHLEAPVRLTGVSRALGYYTGITFELHADTGEAETDLASGGRYDALHRAIHRRAMVTHAARTGQKVPEVPLPLGVGLAFGVEKVAAAVAPLLPKKKRVRVTGPEAVAFGLAQRLRGQGLRVVEQAGAAEATLIATDSGLWQMNIDGATKNVTVEQAEAILREWV